MNLTRSLTRFFLVPLLCAIAFAAVPGVSAETPPDQIKDAGAIPLTIDLLDTMDAAIKSIGEDAAAKAELAAIGKDPNMTQEAWAAAVEAKGPKTAGHFKAAGITADQFAKATSAIMACAMSEELANSEDKAVKANADFVNANNDRANKTFSSFMQLSMPAEP